VIHFNAGAKVNILDVGRVNFIALEFPLNAVAFQVQFLAAALGRRLENLFGQGGAVGSLFKIPAVAAQ
jgi:hypothetical protein